MDGVLVESEEAWFHCLKGICAAVGRRPVTRAELDAAWGQGILDDRRRWFPAVTPEALGRLYDEHFLRESHRVRRMAGAAKALGELRGAGARLACATNSPRSLAETILSRLGLRPLLDDVVGADEAGADKPDPAMLRVLAGRAGAGPAETVMVGDTGRDREAAEAFGCLFVGFRMRRPGRGHPHVAGMEDLVRLLLEGPLPASRGRG